MWPRSARSVIACGDARLAVLAAVAVLVLPAAAAVAGIVAAELGGRIGAGGACSIGSGGGDALRGALGHRRGALGFGLPMRGTLAVRPIAVRLRAIGPTVGRGGGFGAVRAVGDGSGRGSNAGLAAVTRAGRQLRRLLGTRGGGAGAFLLPRGLGDGGGVGLELCEGGFGGGLL